MPVELVQVQRRALVQRDVDDVPVRPLSGNGAISDPPNLRPGWRDPLAEEKSGRQLEVVARRPHRHSHRRPVDPNLERPPRPRDGREHAVRGPSPTRALVSSAHAEVGNASFDPQ